MMLWAALAVSLCACSAVTTPTAIAPQKNGTAVSVRQLMDHSVDYANQTVSLTGTIVVECPEGCWFFLDDGTGKLYVDLKPAGLTIPQKIGSRVTLVGKISGSGGNLQFLGEDVRFLDEN